MDDTQLEPKGYEGPVLVVTGSTCPAASEMDADDASQIDGCRTIVSAICTPAFVFWKFEEKRSVTFVRVVCTSVWPGP
jgi:hypothetical protein